MVELSDQNGAEPSRVTTDACKQCAEPILPGAKLCRICHSYQDWRGYITLSSSVLALLVALVTVLTAAAPVLVSALRTPSSNIVVSTPLVQGHSIYLPVSNLGGAAGVIERAEIRGGHPYGISPEVRFSDPRQALVRPGFQQVELVPLVGLNSTDATSAAVSLLPPTAGKTALMVSVRQSSGAKQSFKFPLSPTDVFNVLTAHAGKCEGKVKLTWYDSDGCLGLKDLQAENDALHERVQGKLRRAAEKR